MPLVGEVIIDARSLMTDLPQAMQTPSIVSASAYNDPSGTIVAGTYYLVVTNQNSFGETAPSQEVPVTVGGGNNAINLIFNAAAGHNSVAKVYIGFAAGNEVGYVTTGIGNVNILNVTTITAAAPPSRSSAYLPDTDGQAVSAYAIYRWLNEALTWAASKNRGGLPDFGAAGTVNGQPNYVMPGWWKKIDTAWFDGYPLGLLNKSSVFRRQPVPGFSGCLIVFQATDRLMVEAWPQPNRTSNQTTLSSGIGATDTTASLTSTTNQLLGFGMYQIDSEIVNYASLNGNQLTGLLRGMCGTVPVAHSIGAPATELNLMISGYRVPSTYSVGSSVSTLYLPPGWDSALVSYMLYLFRSAEQDDRAAQRYLNEATQKLSDLSANRIIAGPRQIQPYGSIGPEVAAGMGSVFGGVIIP